MRLDYALEGYWLSRRRGFSPHTVADYTVTFRRLAEFLGPEREFEKIATTDLNRFLNHLQEDLGLSAKTVLNAWTALSSLWTWAESETGREACDAGEDQAAGVSPATGGAVHGGGGAEAAGCAGAYAGVGSGARGACGGRTADSGAGSGDAADDVGLRSAGERADRAERGRL